MATTSGKNQKEKQKLAASQRRLAEAFLRSRAALASYIGRFLRTKEDVEDVLQETFNKAYKASGGKDIEEPTPFLFRTAHNLSLKDIRRKNNQATDPIADFDELGVISYEPSPEQKIMASEEFSLLCEAVDALPPQCKRVFMLRKVYGLSHKEIEEELGISASTIEKHIAKGMLACRNFFAARDISMSNIKHKLAGKEGRS